ncbi:MAG: hypothetical protein ACRERE_33475 [Candidatus Entotheonellia bacterium]
MAHRSRPTSQKRNKEKARQEKQKNKETRRLEAKARKTSAGAKIGDPDLDLAGIRPGPQPLPEQWDYIRRAE